MVERSYSNANLVEIIREALARTLGRGVDSSRLADGFDLATTFYALRHSRAVVSPETYSSLRAEAPAILRAALAPAGPFTAIPKLGRNFHIRMGRDGRMEVITDNGVLAGRDVVVQLRVERHSGGRPTVSQELIDELDQKACAKLAADGDPLKIGARADLIQQDLAERDVHRAKGTIQNWLKGKR